MRHIPFKLYGLRLPVLLCVLLTLTAAPAALAQQEIILGVGQQKTLSAKNIKRVVIGREEIAGVKVLENTKEILISGISEGSTNLIIWDKNDQKKSVMIQVVAQSPGRIAREVRDILSGIEGIKVKALGTRVVIDGTVFRESDLKKITQIAEMYPQVTSLATLSPTVLDIVATQINNEFQKSGLDELKAVRIGSKIVIEGDVPHEQAKKKAEMIAAAFGIEAMNFADVGISMEKMVVVKVDFIEISKGDMKNLGIKWADSMNIGATAGAGGGFGATDEGDFGGGDSGSGSGGFLSNLFGGGSDDSGGGGSNEGSFKGTYGLSANYGATINMIKSNSRGRVLAQPRLICRSGEKANFVAGGEVAIPLITADTSTVEYKQYGMILNISPIVDNKNNISTKIEVENSQISGFIRGRPNFNTNRVNTSINVKNGQTIVLSGMVNNADAKAVDKVPGVGSLPILGELFKSRSFRNAESELVILVTPEVMAPDDTANTEMVDGIKTKYNDEEEKMKFKLMD